MKIDVIILVYHPTHKLEKILRAVQKQTIKAGKIILMHTEDGKEIPQLEDVEHLVPIREFMVRRDEFDHGMTRHQGICESDADIIIFLTQDAVPANKYLFEQLISTMKNDEEIVAAYAKQKPDRECDLIEDYTRRFNYPDESRIKTIEDVKTLGIKTYFCSNVCAAYRREIYDKLGGFERNIIFNEDMVFAAKAIQSGYKIAYEAQAVVIHSHEYSGYKLLKRNFDQGVSQACHPEIFESVKSETEGIRLVTQTMSFLLKQKKPLLIPVLIFQSFCKYLGYWLGKRYRYLPATIIRKLTMNPEYWKRKEKK